MALEPIDRNSSANVTFDFDDLPTTSFKCQLLRFEPRFTTEAIRLPTFCEEPFGSADPGESNCVIPFAFKVMKNAAEALAPQLMSNPFHVPCVWTYDTGCSITGDFNFPDCTIPRIAGSPVTVGSGVAISDGEFVVAWDVSGS